MKRTSMILAVIGFALCATAQLRVTPIQKGRLTTDLDGNGKSIIGLSSIQLGTSILSSETLETYLTEEVDPIWNADKLNYTTYDSVSNIIALFDVKRATTAINVTGVQSQMLAQAVAHTNRTDNPHTVTADQLGAVTHEGTNVLTSLVVGHTNRTDNPHSVTADQLGALTNETDAVALAALSAYTPTRLLATDDPTAYFSFVGTTGFVYRVTTNVWLVTVNPALMLGPDPLVPAGQYVDTALPIPGAIEPHTWYYPGFGGGIAALQIDAQYKMIYQIGDGHWESSLIEPTATTFTLSPLDLPGVLVYNFQDFTNMVFRMATTNETELLRAWSEAQIAELDSKITDSRTVAQNLWTTLSSHNDTYNGDFATTNLEGFAAFVTNTSPAVAESGGISGAVTNTYLFNLATTNGRVQTATVSAKLYAGSGTRNIYATLYHYDAAGIATCSNTVASPNPNDIRPVFTNTLSISSLSVSGRIVLAIRVEQASGFSIVTTGYGVNDYPMLLSLTHVPLAYVTQSELAAATAGGGATSAQVTNIVAGLVTTNRLWYNVPWAGTTYVGTFADSSTIAVNATNTTGYTFAEIPVENNFPITCRIEYYNNGGTNLLVSVTNIVFLANNASTAVQSGRIIGGFNHTRTTTAPVQQWTYKPNPDTDGNYHCIRIINVNNGTSFTVSRMYNTLRWSPATPEEATAAGL